MTSIICHMEDCYWRLDNHCSLSDIMIENYHCNNYRSHKEAKVIEHPGAEDEYYYCSICNCKDVYIDDNFCLNCGIKFRKKKEC